MKKAVKKGVRKNKDLLKGIKIMILCTVILAASQYFMKLAAPKFSLRISGIFLNWPIYVGFLLLGVGSLLLTAALKKGDLSTIYPIISLSFVWTTLMAIIIFNEQITKLKILGIITIIIGVIFLTRGESS